MKPHRFSMLIIFCIAAITFISSKVNAATISDLAGGSTIQLDSLTFSDWSVVNTSFDLSTISISPDLPSIDPFSEIILMNPNPALIANSGQVRSMTFDFQATDLNGLITSIKSDLRFRNVNGFSFNSPSIRLDTQIGSTQGDSDLGASFHLFNLNTDTRSLLIDFADSSSVWVRTTYTLVGNSGFAQGGFVSGLGLGPAFQTTFFQAEALAVPEPGTFALIALGLAGLCTSHKRDDSGIVPS